MGIYAGYKNGGDRLSIPAKVQFLIVLNQCVMMNTLALKQLVLASDSSYTIKYQHSLLRRAELLEFIISDIAGLVFWKMKAGDKKLAINDARRAVRRAVFLWALLVLGDWGNTRLHAPWLVLGALWCARTMPRLKRQGLILTILE